MYSSVIFTSVYIAWPLAGHTASRNYTMFIIMLLNIQYGSLVTLGFLKADFEALPYNNCKEAFQSCMDREDSRAVKRVSSGFQV